MPNSPLHPGRSLSPADMRTLLLSALGSALEYYDFVIFVYLLATLGHVFFPPQVSGWLVQFQAFAIFAAGYLVRPLGGLVMAHFGDLLGRKRMFTFSIFLMAVSTLGIALLPGYASIGVAAPLLLLLMRLLQGAAVGGELPGAWVFVSEHVPPHRVGLACGLLTCGLSASILLGSLMAAVINAAFTEADLAAYGWRIPFALGGLFGFISVYLRRFLRETPVFQDLMARRALAESMPLKIVLRGYAPAVVASLLLCWVFAGSIVVVLLMSPALLQARYGIASTLTLQANSLATFVGAPGCVFAGVLCDRFGGGRVLTVGSILMAVATFALFEVSPIRPDLLLVPLYGVAGLALSAVVAVPYLMVRAFPPAVAFTGVSFSYNVAFAVFGGLTPLFLQLALRVDGQAPAHYMLGLAALGIVLGLSIGRGFEPVSPSTEGRAVSQES